MAKRKIEMVVNVFNRNTPKSSLFIWNKEEVKYEQVRFVNEYNVLFLIPKLFADDFRKSYSANSDYALFFYTWTSKGYNKLVVIRREPKDIKDMLRLFGKKRIPSGSLAIWDKK